MPFALDSGQPAIDLNRTLSLILCNPQVIHKLLHQDALLENDSVYRTSRPDVQVGNRVCVSTDRLDDRPLLPS